MKKQEETTTPKNKGKMPELEIVNTVQDEGALPIDDGKIVEEETETQEPNEEIETSQKKVSPKEQEEETPKSVLQQLRDFVNQDEDQPFHFDVKAFVGGDGLVRMFARNWVFITLIVFFTCCYVTSRYLMDGAKIENNALNDTLIDRRYKALTSESLLKQHTLSSHVEASLKDSTIHTPTEQSYSLDIDN